MATWQPFLPHFMTRTTSSSIAVAIYFKLAKIIVVKANYGQYTNSLIIVVLRPHQFISCCTGPTDPTFEKIKIVVENFPKKIFFML